MATTYINPCGVYAREEKALAPRRGLEQVACVGLFSNQKHNADLFLDELAQRLKRRHPHLEFATFRKIASEPADFDQRWLSRVQAVAAAFGD